MRESYFFLIVIAIVAVIFTGLFLVMDYKTKEIEENTWHQTGTVIEKYEGWGYVEALIEVESGERYTRDCSICMLGDTVTLQMYKDRPVKITKSITMDLEKKE